MELQAQPAQTPAATHGMDLDPAWVNPRDPGRTTTSSGVLAGVTARIRFDSRFMEARACSRVTPSFSRPMMRCQVKKRVVSGCSPPGRSVFNRPYKLIGR